MVKGGGGGGKLACLVIDKFNIGKVKKKTQNFKYEKGEQHLRVRLKQRTLSWIPCEVVYKELKSACKSRWKEEQDACNL